MECFRQWNSRDQILQLRNKIYLEEKYKNAYYQTAEKEIAQNAEKIGHMRKEVMQESIKFHKADRVVENAIARECEDRKDLKLCLAKATIEGSKELLNKHLYNTVNHYNLNCYEVKKRQKILMELMQTLRSVKKETQFGAGEHNDLQVIRQIENKIEKMDTKINVAKQIYQMYQNILECLQRDAAYIPQRVDSFSAIVDAHKAELTALAQVSREAADARKNMWIELDALEKSYSTEKKERETVLSNRRKLLNLEKYALKRIDASSLRSGSGQSSAAGLKLRKSFSEYATRQHTGTEVTILNEINKLKELMTCSKIQDIEQRISMQSATSDYLQWKLSQRNEKRNHLNKDLNDLMLEHAELKFDPNKTIASLTSLKAGTEQQLKLEKDNLATVLQRLCNSDLLLLFIENGIDNLYYCLYGIPGTTELSTVDPQDTYEKLLICEEKLIFLENKVAGFVVEEWMLPEQEKLVELIERTFGENEQNRNVMVESDDFEMHDDLDYLAAGVDGILTRAEIKRRSELLVQDKTRIVRRVKKKGRKRYVSKKKTVCDMGG
ncbi:coiled-coil domain-containing protein 183-like [Scyliorhinus canicula]|uniref:coiled-coil domain-containing protein 183-like n=1 Tax=Scyliorhinus canicula TaxID=7830 RepID=UPI0018F7A14C|nr:coiled-coil domain-containing protein 183-like [Scyliorhinus canicula]